MSHSYIESSAEFSSAVQAQMIALADRGNMPREANASSSEPGENIHYYFDSRVIPHITMSYGGPSVRTFHTELFLEERRITTPTDPIDTVNGVLDQEDLASYDHIRLESIWRYCIFKEKDSRLSRSLSTTIYGIDALGENPMKLADLPMDGQPKYDKIPKRHRSIGYPAANHPVREYDARQRALRERALRSCEAPLLRYVGEQLDLGRLAVAFRELDIEPAHLLPHLKNIKDIDY